MSTEDEKLTLDTIAKALNTLKKKEFCDNRLLDFLAVFSELNLVQQKSISNTILERSLSYHDLLDHISSLFYLKTQEDEEGYFMALGYGKQEISVATWNGIECPDNFDVIDFTETMDADILAFFIRHWCKEKHKTIKDFCSILRKY